MVLAQSPISFLSFGEGGGALRGLRLLGMGLPVVQFIELLFISILTISDNLSAFSSVNYHYQYHSLPGEKFWNVYFPSPKAFIQFLHLATLCRSNIDRLLLPHGGWGSGVVALLVVLCAHLPCWEGCPSQPTHLCVGWLGTLPGPQWGPPGGQLVC